MNNINKIDYKRKYELARKMLKNHTSVYLCDCETMIIDFNENICITCGVITCEDMCDTKKHCAGYDIDWCKRDIYCKDCWNTGVDCETLCDKCCKNYHQCTACGYHTMNNTDKIDIIHYDENMNYCDSCFIEAINSDNDIHLIPDIILNIIKPFATITINKKNNDINICTNREEYMLLMYQCNKNKTRNFGLPPDHITLPNSKYTELSKYPMISIDIYPSTNLASISKMNAQLELNYSYHWENKIMPQSHITLKYGKIIKEQYNDTELCLESFYDGYLINAFKCDEFEVDDDFKFENLNEFPDLPPLKKCELLWEWKMYDVAYWHSPYPETGPGIYTISKEGVLLKALIDEKHNLQMGDNRTTVYDTDNCLIIFNSGDVYSTIVIRHTSEPELQNLLN